MREWFGDRVVDFCGQLDVEGDYEWFEGVPPSKYLTTKTGPGKYASVVKDGEGRVSEWTMQFCGEGLKFCGRDMKTGTTCSYEMAKESDIFGKFKVLSISGAKDVLKLIGVPEPMATQLSNDTSGVTQFCHKGPMVSYKYCSNVANIDILFKWDEETTYFDPVMKTNNTFVASKVGRNCIKSVTKSPDHTFIACMTVGENFLVEKVHLEGLDCMPWTVIYQRC